MTDIQVIFLGYFIVSFLIVYVTNRLFYLNTFNSGYTTITYIIKIITEIVEVWRLPITFT